MRSVVVAALAAANPFVGTAGQGNTFPGAQVPFGFAAPSPDNPPPTSTSGYTFGRPVLGFSQTHVSGTGGGSRYGNFRITPETGDVVLAGRESPVLIERARPGYYSALLSRWGIRVRLTATRRVAVHRYTFPAAVTPRLVLEAGSVIRPANVLDAQRTLSAGVRVVSPRRIDGRVTVRGGWGHPGPYTLYFSLWLSRPATIAPRQVDGFPGAVASFAAGTREVDARVGLSFVSARRAARNVKRETGAGSFRSVSRAAARRWRRALGRISVAGGTRSERRTFYSAMYHAQLMPHDLSGENIWWRSRSPHYEEFYALWDTFRALHPLLTVIAPRRQAGMVQSLVETYEHTGWMPDARVAGVPGYQESGTSGDIVVADAVGKGLRGFDVRGAYRALRKNAEVESPEPLYFGRSLADYRSLGYVSTRIRHSASKTLEYSYEDYAISRVAKALGRRGAARRYLRRSRNWRSLWDPDTATVRPRDAGGAFAEPFDPDREFTEDFYEGSARQYSTFVPHDVAGLARRLGGDAALVTWLDRLFADGAYSQANEADLLAPFLFIHAGRPDRAQAVVRDLLARSYADTPAGLPGNDDSGALSAWFAWSSIGLFPNAGQPYYYVVSPLFRRVRIKLGRGRVFTISAPRASARNVYVQAARLNGKRLPRPFLRHRELMRGGELELRLGPRPSTWGSARRPPSPAGPG